MLTELIEEYAKRYVEINVSAHEHRAYKARWRASVKTKGQHYTSSELPVASFKASGASPNDLAMNLRCLLTLCEPIIAHRERTLAEYDRIRLASRVEYLKAHPLATDAAGNLQPNTGAIQ